MSERPRILVADDKESLQTTHGARSYRVAVDLHPNELAWWDTTAGMRSTTQAPNVEVPA